MTTSTGASSSGYGFTNEYHSQGLIYLRSRMYSPTTGRFLTRDTWGGNANRPLSFNRWAYVEANPINLTDPSGLSPYSDADIRACISSPKLNGLESNFKMDICQMIGELRREGYLRADVAYDAHITEGLRSAESAHKYSTAWHILHDFVSIDDLRETPKDLDRNVWYKDDWDIYYCLSQITHDGAQRRVWKEYLDYLIKKNASDQVPPEMRYGGLRKGTIYTPFGVISDVPYAMEGYHRGSPYRLPNSEYPIVSKHVTGWAVDISRNLLDNILWEQGGYTVIDEIARKYWLIRPYNNQHYVYYMSAHDRQNLVREWWHFERVFNFR